MVWLASKGKPSFDSGGGLAGYFFYETVRGYHFIPIDELIAEGIKRVKKMEMHTIMSQEKFRHMAKILTETY